MVTTRPATTNQEAVGPGPGVSVKPQILWLPKNSRNFGQAVQGRSKLQTYWSYWFHIDFTSIYIYIYIYIQKGSSTEFFMFFPNSQHLACSWAILSSKSAVFKRPAMATARGIGVSREGDSIAPVTPSGVCSPSGIKVVCNAVGRTLGMVGLSISDL